MGATIQAAALDIPGSAAGLKSSSRGKLPEFRELMEQLDEQKSNLEKLNQVADRSESNQNQREIG